MTTRPLPDLPGTMSLDEVRATVAAFGWQLLIAPADAPRTPPGFGPPATGFIPVGAEHGLASLNGSGTTAKTLPGVPR